MPALPSVANVIRSGFRFGQPAGEALGKVALHFAFTGGPPSPANLVSIANDFMAATSTHLAPLMASEISWQDVTNTDLTSPTSAVGISTHATVPGTRGSGDNPSPLCVYTNYDLSRRYRGGHPKSFWPFGVASDQGSFNDWSSSLITAVDAAVPAFIAECLASTHGGVALTDWVMVSYFHGATPFTEPSGRVRMINTLRATPLVDSLTYGFAQSVYGVQRRRRGKV